MSPDLKGEIVAVVGASSGIGLAVAQAVAMQGAEVVMFARSADRLEQAANRVAGTRRMHAIDMLRAEDVDRAVATFPRIDHLVLTAVADELARAKPLAQLDLGDVERSFDKLRGYFNFVKAAAPRIPKTGSIVMLCGAASVRPPVSGFALLAAEGAAIPGLGRALARELAPVRVNVVMAGAVDTPIHAAHRDDVARWAESLPAQRFAQPGDIADAVLFVIGNPMMTGSVLTVDGGLMVS